MSGSTYVQALVALTLAVGITVPALATNGAPALSFAHPAAKWTEAIPLGNGHIGAMDFGGVEDQRFQINETTLWGGAPHEYAKPGAADHLDEVRSLVFQGKIAEAERLADSMMGAPKLLMPYQPFCDLRLHFPKTDTPSAYHRGLDMTTAVSSTEYTVGGVSFHRESFVSFPDQALVVRTTASKPGQLTFTVGMDSPQPGTQASSTADGSVNLTGQIQPRQNSPRSWTGSWTEPGLKFAASVKVLNEGGTVQAAGDHLEVANANSVTMVFTNATTFRSYRDISGDAVAAVHDTLDRAVKKSYAQLKVGHTADFGALFSRVQLQLGSAQFEHSAEPTDERIHQFAQTEDSDLLALYFEFGRYLLISSSRAGGQAANLQGI